MTLQSVFLFRRPCFRELPETDGRLSHRLGARRRWLRVLHVGLWIGVTLLSGGTPALANQPPIEVSGYLGPGGQLVLPGTLPPTFDLDLLALVTDPEGDPLEILSATPRDPAHQLLSNGDGTYRLTVEPSFSGTVVIDFTVRELRDLPNGGLPSPHPFTVSLQVGEGGGSGPTPSPPAAPSGLRASLGDPGPIVNLAWLDNSTDEEGFTIWRAVGAGAFQPHLSVAADGQSAVDSLVSVGVTYSYFVEAFNADGGAVSETVTIAVTDVSQSPFRGERYRVGPWSTVVQVEDYDLGGNGVAYFDTTPGNTPGSYREDDVDLMHVYKSNLPAKESHVALVNVAATEWLEYSVTSESSNLTHLILRASNDAQEDRFHFEVDGTDVTGQEVLPSTNNQYRYLDYALPGLGSDGPHTLKLVFDSASTKVALDWFRLDQFFYMLDSFARAGQGGDGAPIPGQAPEGIDNPDIVWEGSPAVVKKTTLLGQEFAGMDAQSDAVATIPIQWLFSGIASQADAVTIDTQVEPGGPESWVGVGFTATPAGGFFAEPTPTNPQGHSQVWLRLSGNGSYAVHVRGDSHTLASGSWPLESSGPTSVRLEVSGILSLSSPIMRLKVWIDHFLVCCDPGVDLKTLVPGWSPMINRAGFHLHQRSGAVKVDDFYVGASTNGSVDPPGPIAVDDDLRSVGINEDGGTVLLEGILDNDVPPLLVQILGAAVLPPTSGSTVSVGSDNRSLVFTPGPDFAGEQQISYTILDDQGLTDSGVVTVSVTPVNDPPVALMSLSCGGFGCAFDGSDTFDVDNTQAELSFEWQFGDGKTSSLVQGTHTYADEGSYDLTLTATDPALAASSATVPGILIDPPPVPVFQVDCFGLLCVFNGTASTRDGVHTDGLTFDWSFGDGSPEPVSASIVVHEYSAQGIYLPTLTVIDHGPAGGQTAQSSQVLNLDFPPVAAFTFDCQALTCTFDASSSSSDSITFAWSFGDGSAAASGPLVEHTFPSEGLFSVTLTVTDPGGQSGSAAELVDLDLPPSAAFTFDCLDVTCTFDASSSSSDSVSFTWDFGDGSPIASGSVAEHTFPTDGAFAVTLTVEDGRSQTDTSIRTVDVFDELLFLLLQAED